MMATLFCAGQLVDKYKEKHLEKAYNRGPRKDVLSLPLMRKVVSKMYTFKFDTGNV